MKKKFAHDLLFGIAVGDALGVPVEFKPREWLSRDPVLGMRGFGSHNQPPGTWSDDSSLAFCLAESLCEKGYDLADLSERFVGWAYKGQWTPHGEVFDIGNATAQAIERLRKGSQPTAAGGRGALDNGNGSLMRILPLLAHVRFMPLEAKYKAVAECSSLTHRHPRSQLACWLLVVYAEALLAGQGPDGAFRQMRADTLNLFRMGTGLAEEARMELPVFERLLGGPDNNRAAFEGFKNLPAQDIRSSGYVVDTLEAALWCLANTSSYEAAVLAAVNLGNDTDTTGAVAGGLAGLHYGLAAIPQAWREGLARKDGIGALANRLDAYTLGLHFRHRCPTCATPLPEIPRYPRYLCEACVGKATDKAGERLEFFNTGFGGGYGARYAGSGAPYDSHVCFVAGKNCRAGEARFGGLVVQAVE